MERDLERAPSWETWDEAANGREAEGAVAVGEFCASRQSDAGSRSHEKHTGIVDDMASNLELLDGDLAVPGEDQNVPVLVPHLESGVRTVMGCRTRRCGEHV